MAEMNLIWYNKKLRPTKKTGFFVYDFGYEKAVEEYSEFFFNSENLKRWAYWEDIEKAIKENEELKKNICYIKDVVSLREKTKYFKAIDEIKELKKQNLLLSIANAELQDRFYSYKDFKETAYDFDISEIKDDFKIIIKKLLQTKPELEEWIKLNFKGYL